ncbi:hypothetical protein LZ30DRAFT_375866 [Colletotrichum cereale]|nr:hypothetical protein LZ30DRAFT_375866 [Colletotrichum cereale]
MQRASMRSVANNARWSRSKLIAGIGTRSGQPYKLTSPIGDRLWPSWGGGDSSSKQARNTGSNPRRQPYATGGKVAKRNISRRTIKEEAQPDINKLQTTQMTRGLPSPAQEQLSQGNGADWFPRGGWRGNLSRPYRETHWRSRDAPAVWNARDSEGRAAEGRQPGAAMASGISGGDPGCQALDDWQRPVVVWVK